MEYLISILAIIVRNGFFSLKMNPDTWTDLTDNLAKYIVEKEKTFDGPVRVWTNGIDDTYKTKYEQQANNLEFVVVSKSEEVAAVMFILIRFKIDDWDAEGIVDYLEEGLEGKDITVENLYDCLKNFETTFLDKEALSEIISTKLFTSYVIDKDGQPKTQRDLDRKNDIHSKYKKIDEHPSSPNKDGSVRIMVDMILEKPLSEAELFTPTQWCLKHLLDY